MLLHHTYDLFLFCFPAIFHTVAPILFNAFSSISLFIVLPPSIQLSPVEEEAGELHYQRRRQEGVAILIHSGPPPTHQQTKEKLISRYHLPTHPLYISRR